MTWRLENIEKKRALDIQYWQKQDRTFTRTVGYRWGIYECLSEHRPDVDLTNPWGWSAFEEGWQVFDLVDESFNLYDYHSDFTEQEREHIETLDYNQLEEEGWTCLEAEQMLEGPLRLTNSQTGQEFRA